MSNKERIKEIALSVDVEDGINIAMRDIFGKEIPPTKRVVINTDRILDLLEQYNAKATFFILGQVAEQYPELVKKIHKQGHEIGVHGYDHLRFDRMDPEMARSQIGRAKALLEDLTGEEVAGHRAPAFSVNARTKWALPLLAELGFIYDSSIMPCRSLNYGWPEFPEDVTEIIFNNRGSLIEIPMTTIDIGLKNIPCFGGSCFLLLPYVLTKLCVKKAGRKRNPVFYMHPYEIDTKRYPEYFFQELKKSDNKTRLKMRLMWINRGTVENKLIKLISQNRTCTMRNVIEKIRSPINKIYHESEL